MNTKTFSIDRDIRRAETLPSCFYTEEEYFEASKQKIFARSWQLTGTIDEVEGLRPHLLLEGFLDEPILFTRQNGDVHCISNVCTHRGNLLVEEACAAKGVRCGYHGRRFSPDGKFLSMPEFEDAVDFPTEKDDLKQIPFGVWRNFLFVSLDPFAPLEQFVGEMDARLAGFEFDHLRFVSARDYELKAHWALYCENYVEGFHIPYVHKTLSDKIDYGSYTTDTFRFSSVQTALSDSGKRPEAAVSEPPAAAGGLIPPSGSVSEPPAVAGGLIPPSGSVSEPLAAAGGLIPPSGSVSEPLAVAGGLIPPSGSVSEPLAAAGGLTIRSDPFGQNRAAYYFFVFPNLMFNFYPWGISINIVKPLKKDLTKITFLTYVSDESKLETGAGTDLHRVELEDERVVENVQKGINSRFYDRGRYSPSREQGTHHFHRLIAEFMD